MGQASYEILVHELLSPAEVLTVLTDLPRPSTPEIERIIEKEWLRQMQSAETEQRRLYNGSLWRLVRHDLHRDANQKRLTLTLGPTCYRDFIGTNLFHAHLLTEHPWERFANPVGISALVISSDRRILIGRRSNSVSYHRNTLHTFGGVLEACDVSQDGSLCVFSSIRRELTEELALHPEELQQIRCSGLVYDLALLQPELLFEAEVPLPEREIRKRWSQAPSQHEHCELVSLPEDALQAREQLEGQGPVAQITLAALKLRFER